MKRKDKKIGKLLVITGASGAGKDSVMDGLLKHEKIVLLKFEKVVTCTDRHMRPGEIDGVHYHFVTAEKLIEMADGGMLVEEITRTGTSNKATPKSEIEKLLSGTDLVWRIDPSRAAEIAGGKFFHKLFPSNTGRLQKNTCVICVTATKEEIEGRRKSRDGEKYNPEEYRARDEQETPHLNVLYQKAEVINNPDGNLGKAIDEAVEKVTIFYE